MNDSDVRLDGQTGRVVFERLVLGDRYERDPSWRPMDLAFAKQ